MTRSWACRIPPYPCQSPAWSRAGVASLTASQWTLLGLVGEGLTNDAIAQRLFLTPKSAENALSRLYVRLGIVTAEAEHNPRVLAARMFLEQSVYPI